MRFRIVAGGNTEAGRILDTFDTLLFHAAAMEHFWLFLGGVILIFGYAVSSLSSAKPPAKQKKRQ